MVWYLVQYGTVAAIAAKSHCSCKIEVFSVWAHGAQLHVLLEFDWHNHGKILKIFDFSQVARENKHKIIMIKDVVTRSQYCVGWVQHMFLFLFSTLYRKNTQTNETLAKAALFILQRDANGIPTATVEKMKIHPRTLTWIPKMMVCKR